MWEECVLYESQVLSSCILSGLCKHMMGVTMMQGV